MPLLLFRARFFALGTKWLAITAISFVSFFRSRAIPRDDGDTPLVPGDSITGLFFGFPNLFCVPSCPLYCQQSDSCHAAKKFPFVLKLRIFPSFPCALWSEVLTLTVDFCFWVSPRLRASVVGVFWLRLCRAVAKGFAFPITAIPRDLIYTCWFR